MFNAYSQRIYHYCKKLMRGRSITLVEECVQNTFLQVQANLSKLRNHPNIAGWLYVTSRNQVNAMYRKLYREQKHEVTLSDEQTKRLTANHQDEICEVLMGTADIDNLAHHVLQQLNLKESEFYVDYFKRHLSVRALSQKYNVSESAVTTRIYRLRKKIRNAARHTLFG
ncbi:RNA polymerase sigma factor [Cohnella rhizosphaerae]|uniref:Sigma-70 family RNA polymerase sigma factor n=1 Tax=Cohnella rhizosphaerae TaxID=1457232 RepID=A0A9X4KSF3_9BACL|nr:sigma-70 family RNA polymerase sigma factor [Cohnella rhizosphaerae]MDG0810336.1 sigma-70 family RNA polymerase sigma factor [Cohnella rhizosphaerae]